MNTTYFVPFFLGTFSGFLATLPIGPAKLLTLRKFLLISKGNEITLFPLKPSNTILLGSISGLIAAQIVFFLSLQFSFLYSLWIQPYFLTLFFPVVLLIYTYQFNNVSFFNISSRQYFLKSESNFYDQLGSFLETFLFQLLNPVLLPTPVFSRIINVFVFRYSTLSIFFVGTFLGLLTGYGTFYIGSLYLLKKLDLEAPTTYKIFKIRLNKFFNVLLFSIFLLCINKLPLPSVNPFTLGNFKSESSKLKFDKNSYENPFFNTFFTSKRWIRPLRLIDYNGSLQTKEGSFKPFNKMSFSQFFFEEGIKDGNLKLFSNFPKSVATISQDINSTVIDIPSNVPFPLNEKSTNQKFSQDWRQNKRNRYKEICQNINFKINKIQKGFSFQELIEKKRSSLDNDGNFLSKQLDPRLTTEVYVILKKKKDLLVSGQKKEFPEIATKNKLELLFSQSNQTTPYTSFLPWQPLIQKFVENYKNLDRSHLANNGLNETKSNVNGKNSVTILNDSDTSFVFENKVHKKEINQQEKLTKFKNLKKSLALWDSKLTKKSFAELFRILDAELFKKKIPVNRFKNLVFLPENLEDFEISVNEDVPTLRRNEFPGTVPTRRTKAVVSNLLQKKAYSPFFLKTNKILKNFVLKNKTIKLKKNRVIIQKRIKRSKNQIFIFMRNLALSFQAYFRKTIKLPFLIILKNLTRQLFYQSGEWEKDWKELSQEVYIECDSFGKINEKFSSADASNPNQTKIITIGVKLSKLWDPPKEIKIINPFQLRFWTRSNKTYSNSFENSSFLTVLGQEARILNGPIKKAPSFSQLLIKKIKLILQYKVFKKEERKISKQINPNLAGNLKNEQASIEFQEIQKDKGKKDNLNVLKSWKTYKKSRKNVMKNSTPVNLGSPKTEKEKIKRQLQETPASISINFQKRWFHLYRFLVKKEKSLFFQGQQKVFDLYKIVLHKQTKIRKSYLDLFSNCTSTLQFFFSQISDFLTYFLVELKPFPNSSSPDIDIVKLTYPQVLSQAYIAQNIWEEKILNKPDLTSVMNVWTEKNPLDKTLEDFLNKQGILGVTNPTFLTDAQWKEWLKGINALTPPLKIWDKLSPTSWTHSVEQYWKKQSYSQLEGIFQLQQRTSDAKIKSKENLNTYFSNNFLEFHSPLFQAAQKQKKLWKFHVLAQSYLQVLNDNDLNSFNLWDPTEFEKKTKFLFKQDKESEQETRNRLNTSPLLSSFSEITKKKSEKTLLDKETIKQLAQSKLEKSTFKLQTKIQQENFFPLLLKRWERKGVQNRLYRWVRWNNRQNKKHVLGTNKFFLQELFYKKILKPRIEDAKNVTTVVAEDPWSVKPDDIVNFEFKAEDILDNWNSRVLDDEVVMYNTISSILAFENKNGQILFDSSSFPFLFSQKKSSSLNSDFILLEELYFSKDIQEKRILDSFKLENEIQDNQNKSNINESLLPFFNQDFKRDKTNLQPIKMKNWFLMSQDNQNPIRNRQSIVRFLWPTHRLEDLSCMNRFWIGTVNQSRFSMLRIQTFPGI